MTAALGSIGIGGCTETTYLPLLGAADTDSGEQRGQDAGQGGPATGQAPLNPGGSGAAFRTLPDFPSEDQFVAVLDRYCTRSMECDGTDWSSVRECFTFVGENFLERAEYYDGNDCALAYFNLVDCAGTVGECDIVTYQDGDETYEYAGLFGDCDAAVDLLEESCR